MKRVELLPGITTSALGFGCAPILGSVGAEDSKRALAIALDEGVTHFDLARSYGYGSAERFVGGYIKDQRSRLTIATKFGIEARRSASILAPLKPMVRALRGGKQVSGNSSAKAQVSGLFHRRLEITPELMRKSLEKSLREIGTDYIDMFFVHETFSSITRIDEVIALAETLKGEGKIRAFGLAYMWQQKPLHKEYASGVDIHQFDNSPGTESYAEIADSRGGLPNIFFSPLRGRVEGKTPAEILQQISGDFPKSVTLCSMFKSQHIKANATAFS